MSRQVKDNIIKGLIYASSAFTVVILAVIIGFILIKGLPRINMDFLTNSYEDKTTYVTIGATADGHTKIQDNQCVSEALGATLSVGEEGLVVEKIEKASLLKAGVDGTGAVYEIKKGDVITKLGSCQVERELKNGTSAEEVLEESTKAIQENTGKMKVKVVRRGGGIFPMIVTTIYMVGLSLVIAGPIGILAAIYLNEYAKKGKMMTIIHFAIENLAGIPSIIYGLFGSLVFVQMMKLQYSILAGALTISIILLPTIITTTEETLKTIPKTYRESSLGLGATKLQTITKVVLPNAISGILVAVLLSIGRIVGESAALLLTAGTVSQIPSRLYGNSASGATLTIKAYMLMKEENDLTTACAIGVILLTIVIVINVSSKLVTKYFLNSKGEKA
ncbi:MAG: phosphate ABC transporter permease PstA [Lachnospiraceae bacterium]|nr:phosphate ABC transporter permease PstA [Lachnospiraceae bacterium]